MTAETPRVALVTGANRGLGLETAKQLASRGIHVITSARDLEKARVAARTIREAGGHASPLAIDVADDASIRAAAASVEQDPGGLDILINNAGIHYDTWQSPTGANFEIVDEAWRANARGAWLLAATLAPILCRSSNARIVNVSSEGGSLASMGASTPAYSVTKAAMNAVTRILAAELGPKGVLVNSVCPGWTATDMGGGGRPVEDGAAGIVWAATLPSDGPNGGFFRDGERLPW